MTCLIRGRWENFWSSEQTSVVRLDSPDDVIDKMTYALSNPVKDRLVEKAHHWPGVTSLEALRHGRSSSASRPRHFFREKSELPEIVSLSFARPNGFEDLSNATFTALVLQKIQAVEERTSAERHRTGARVLGRKSVLDQKWHERPSSREPRRQLNPRVAARSKWNRIEALMRNRAFRDAYESARASFAAGLRDVIFPAGTYWLRLFTSALCAPCPRPA